MRLKGPRTLPRPAATASKIGWCSLATCSLVVIGVARGMGDSFRLVGDSTGRQSSTRVEGPFRLAAALDVAAARGAVSLPMSVQGSTAYTDVNTLLEQHARQRPDKIVVESPDQGARITFGELDALTRRFASFLAANGVRQGDRISLLSDNGIEPLIVFWGALRAGVILNPINVEIREKHVSQILHDVAPKAVFWSCELPTDPRGLGTGGALWIPFGG